MTVHGPGLGHNSAVRVRALNEADLAVADHVMRIAFGTFLGLPEPATFMGDADYVRSRWKSNPSAAFAAELDGELVGSNFAANWGSVGFFGPLTVRPAIWDRGVGKRLIEPAMECFSRWGTTHAGLFTFAQSQKHLSLYQRFGFWPRFLTAIMSKQIGGSKRTPSWSRLADLSSEAGETGLSACRNLTGSIYDGLDVTLEIRAVANQRLGETVLLWDESALAGFAVCHCGPSTEAGTGSCYIKFGAVRSGRASKTRFKELLTACEGMASERGLVRIVAGVNTGRDQAYRTLMGYGFQTDRLGVAMHRPNKPGYNRPGVFIIDDWR